MFSATDKMATVLKPHQLVEMRLGSTEIKYHEIQQDEFFKHAKDLISRYGLYFVSTYSLGWAKNNIFSNFN